jgi:dTDP-4-dehydrorhamnose reductase
MAAKKILITGSNGLLGQYLIKLLLNNQEAYDVYGSGKGANRMKLLPNNKYITLNIEDGTAIYDTVTVLRPDVIIHTAAMTNVDACETDPIAAHALNVMPLRFLTMICKEHNIHLIHLSTDFIFDGASGPYTETDTANPISVYGSSKWQAEKIVMETNINYSILRTAIVYGVVADMSRSNIILWVKKELEAGKTIKVVNDQWRTPTYALDLAMGCKLCIDKNAFGIYNISGKDFLCPYEMATKTAAFYHLNSSLIQEVDSTQFKQPAARPPKTGLILDKAIKDLGYAPHSFEEGIAAMQKDLDN